MSGAGGEGALEAGKEEGTPVVVVEERDIMCGACGQILKRNAFQFCVRCGVKLNPESVWDALLCNSTHDTPNIARVREEMITRFVKVVIADGRIFVGRFLGFDKQRSMILNECREYRRVKLDDDGPGTHLEQVGVFFSLHASHYSMAQRKKRRGTQGSSLLVGSTSSRSTGPR
jgi:small nuclear ribonucleoprotein (snRNP)-like protein